jgi:hypothetical protein
VSNENGLRNREGPSLAAEPVDAATEITWAYSRYPLKCPATADRERLAPTRTESVSLLTNTDPAKFCPDADDPPGAWRGHFENRAHDRVGAKRSVSPNPSTPRDQTLAQPLGQSLLVERENRVNPGARNAGMCPEAGLFVRLRRSSRSQLRCRGRVMRIRTKGCGPHFPRAPMRLPDK